MVNTVGRQIAAAVFGAMILWAGFCGPAAAECSNIDDLTHQCRHPAGDSWCELNSGRPLYAYADKCLKIRKLRSPGVVIRVPKEGARDPATIWNCTDSKNTVELAICNTADLHAINERLEGLVGQARDASVVQTQQRWVGERRNTCRDIACLRQVYAERIRDLEAKVAPPPPMISAAPPPVAAPSPEIDSPPQPPVARDVTPALPAVAQPAESFPIAPASLPNESPAPVQRAATAAAVVADKPADPLPPPPKIETPPVEPPSFQFPTLDRTTLAALLIGGVVALLGLVVWLLRRQIRAALERTIAWLRTAVVDLAQKSESIATKTQDRARSTYEEARPRVQAAASSLVDETHRIAIEAKAQAVPAYRAALPRVQAAVGNFVSLLNAYGFSPARFAAITLPLFVLTIFLFGWNLTTVVILFAPLAGIGLFADYRSRRVHTDSPSERLFSPLRFAVISLPLILLSQAILNGYSILTVIPVVALLAFFNVFDAPVGATHSLRRRFFPRRLTIISLPLILITIWLIINVGAYMGAMLGLSAFEPYCSGPPYRATHDFSDYLDPQTKYYLEHPECNPKNTGPNRAAYVAKERGILIYSDLWALLAILYLDFRLLSKFSFINRKEIFRICAAASMVLGRMIFAGLFSIGVSVEKTILFEPGTLTSFLGQIDPFVILPLLMILFGTLSSFLVLFTLLAIFVMVALPVIVLFNQLNTLAITRQRLHKRTGDIHTWALRFEHWLSGEPMPPVPPDDSQGARFATPDEIAAIIANRPAA